MKKMSLFLTVLIISFAAFADDGRSKCIISAGEKNDSNTEIIYSYNFEENAQNWTVMGTELGWVWGDVNSLSSAYLSFAGNNTSFLGINSDAAGSGVQVSDMAISPVMDLSSYADDNLKLNFKYIFNNSYGGIVSLNYRLGPASEWILLDFLEPDSWIDYSFDLPQEVMNSEIQFGFLYDDEGNWAGGAGIDDVEILMFNDESAPEFVSLKGNYAYCGDDMNLLLCVSDETGVPNTIEAVYDVGDGEEVLMMNLETEKDDYYYSGIIPSQSVPITTSITFHLSDTASPSNECEIVKTILWKNSSYYIADGFEDYEPFSLDFYPWQSLDLDGSATFGITDAEFPNQGYTGSFIVFNPSLVSPELDEEWEAHGGDAYLACFAATDGINNDWLISPKVSIGEKYKLKFWAKSVTDAFGLERFKVGISNTGIEATDFEIISEGEYVEAFSEWTEYSLDLEPYAGRSDCYIGINCISSDAFCFMVDDFEISDGSGVEEVIPESTVLYQNYPNPFNPITTINFFNSNATSIKLSVFNSKGELVQSLIDRNMQTGNHSIAFNAANLNSGVYYYTLETSTRSVTKKMILLK